MRKVLIMISLSLVGCLRLRSSIVQPIRSRLSLDSRLFSATRSASNITKDHLKVSKKFKPVPFGYHEEVTITITDLTNLGQGVGRHTLNDGSQWVIMVPLVLPGEIVKARVFNNHATYSEADLVEVLTQSPDRVTPQCKYFSQCGGCQYQHMNITAQRQWKKSQVEDALQRIGGLVNVQVSAAVGTDDLYGYRSKLTPHYDRPPQRDNNSGSSSNSNSKLSKKQLQDKYSEDYGEEGPLPSGRDVPIGFVRRGTRSVLDVDDCIIATDAIRAKYADTRKRLRSTILSPKHGTAKNGATLLFREVDGGVVEVDSNKLVQETVNGVLYRYKAGEFFQNNPFVLPSLVNHVMAEATAMTDSSGSNSSSSSNNHNNRTPSNNNNNSSCSFLIDAYCGSGLFALAAASRFKYVYGVEVSSLAVSAATENAKLNNVTNVEFLCGQSEAIFASVTHLPKDDTAVVIDPPRKGCDEAFLSQLFDFSPRRIVYVSCDPATQARDAKSIVAAGYAVTNVTPFDLFPQTRHIENVMTFVRND